MPGAFAKLFKKLFQNPLAVDLELESSNHFKIHRQIFMTNPVLKSAYERWYRETVSVLRGTASVPGVLLEIGCGSGFLEHHVPGLLKTDAIPNPFATRVVDAMNLDFESNSVRAMFLIGVFHHLSCPIQFLKHAERCLHPGGRLLLIEPNNSFPQKLLCRVLDHYEYYDETLTEWKTPLAKTMTGANLAMAWMIFIRDADRFHTMFPKLRIKNIRYHTFLAYYVSGGMTYKPFIPVAFLPLLNGIERLLTPLGRWLFSMMTIEIERVA